MLRLACSLTTERGISIVAPVHDAVMVEGPADSIDAIVAETQTAMAEASAVILDGFRLRSDAKIVRWPKRYMDERGREFWGRVMELVGEKRKVDERLTIVDACSEHVRKCQGVRAEMPGDTCGNATPV